MLDKNAKIYVAGHHGLVGSAIWANLKARGYNNLIGRAQKEQLLNAMRIGIRNNITLHLHILHQEVGTI